MRKIDRGREEVEGIGFSEGMGGFFGGIGFVVVTPSVWPFACVPVLTALLLGCGLSMLGFLGVWHYAESWIGDANWMATTGKWLVTISLWLVMAIASVILALTLAQPFSGWALEAVSLRQERALTGRHRPEPSFLHSLWVAIRCTLFTLIVGTIVIGGLLVVNLFFPPAAVVTIPLKFFVVAWLLAWDFLDYPLGLRCMGIRRRAAWVFSHFWAFTVFGLAWATVLLVPFLALFVLPFGVAGATRLVVAAERDEPLEALPA